LPIYEYECQACGTVAEVMQKVDAPAPDACEKCAKGPLVKLMSRTAYVLKGSGWYVTDFRSGNKKPADKKPATEGASETKADAPAEAKPSTPEAAPAKAPDSKPV
jgi:putative FmdB family regulatory protein